MSTFRLSTLLIASVLTIAYLLDIKEAASAEALFSPAIAILVRSAVVISWIGHIIAWQRDHVVARSAADRDIVLARLNTFQKRVEELASMRRTERNLALLHDVGVPRRRLNSVDN